MHVYTYDKYNKLYTLNFWMKYQMSKNKIYLL